MIQYYVIVGLIVGISSIAFLHGKQVKDPIISVEEDEKNEQKEQQKQEQQEQQNVEKTNQKKGKKMSKEQQEFLKKKEEEQKKKEEEQKKKEELAAKYAKERQERVLSKLNPEERKIMEEFFEKQRTKGKSDTDINYGFIFLEVFIVFMCILLIYTFYILTTDNFYSPLQIWDLMVEFYETHTGPLKEENIPIALDL